MSEGEDGFLFITGRNSRAIIRFDLKVSLDRIEGKLRTCKYTKDVAVFSDNDKIIAYIVLYQEYQGENIGEEKIMRRFKMEEIL